MRRNGKSRCFDSPEERWAGVGPYYAMFPNAFARHVVERYSQPGELTLDPFAGRGTTPYWSAVTGRQSVGIEINPVGWVYAKAKLQTATRSSVEERIRDIGRHAWRYRKAAEKLPAFFQGCFSQEVRCFLLSARKRLDWRRKKADWTTMALLLVHLHGKNTDSLSNQMRQTKALSPDYALRWWAEREMMPPEINPVDFLLKKLDWRFARGTPKLKGANILLGDSEERLGDVERRIAQGGLPRASLLLTSPPYCGVTNYHYDQWIRLWLLGGADKPAAPVDGKRGKFVDREAYHRLLHSVFSRSAGLLRKDATVYVRTDSRRLTLDMTVDVLHSVFPKKRLRKVRRPLRGQSQTSLFGGKATAEGEIDLVLLP